MSVRIKTIAILSAGLMTAAGCSKFEESFLSVQRVGEATIDTFFSNLEGLSMAGVGLHKDLKSYVDGPLVKYGEIRGDLLYATLNADEGDLLTFNYELTAEHVATYPRNLWAAGWSVVSAANDILYYGEQLRKTYTAPSELAVLEKVLAQARFARAFAHFTLCNSYAWPYTYTEDHSHLGIPIMDHVPGFEEKVDRKSVGRVYELVVSDLLESIKLFNSSAERDPVNAQVNCQINSVSNCYYISEIASEALLARVYLYMEDWENAEKYSKYIIEKVPLTSYSDYVDMFRNSQAKRGTESILRMDTYNSSSSMTSFYDYNRNPSFQPDKSTYELFDDDDVRKTLLYYIPKPGETSYEEGAVYEAVCKYSYNRDIEDVNLQVSDCFVLRASESYLIHAEALVKGSGDITGALNDVKALIARAKGVDAASVDITASGEQAMLSLIELERKRELCFEGHRFYDILRQKKDLKRPETSNSKMKSLAWPDYRFILPIDRMEMQYNEFMKQNPGYQDYKKDAGLVPVGSETEEPAD
mgnify:CR=1 FL=1